MGDGSGFALRWLLPAEFADGDVSRTRRTPQEWVLNILIFCGAVLLGLVVAGLAWKRRRGWGAAHRLALAA